MGVLGLSSATGETLQALRVLFNGLWVVVWDSKSKLDGGLKYHTRVYTGS